MAQPYSSYAKALLERQNYPDMRLYPGGPPKRPYDVTAHTLPLLMGVDVETLGMPLPGTRARELCRRRAPPPAVSRLRTPIPGWPSTASGNPAARSGAIR